MNHLPRSSCFLALLGCYAPWAEPGANAVEFTKETSCISVETDSDAHPEQLTVELWLRAAEELLYIDHPLVTWPGGFALWVDQDGVGWFTDSARSNGASYATGFLDGELHHVAGTWDGETSTLFVDGERVGFSPAIFGEDPGDTLYIGCWGTQEIFYEGLLDEVRISSVVRYTEDFTLESVPFESDDDTLSLWHLDEGEGEWSLDAMGRYDASLVDLDWISFELTEP
ncbi:MAG: LamG domain-containing protein [Myxococcota bacterium]|nr:LamG domain-containing protein [Myxococcota bacterium]